jgi:uroporphyrinogen decarboxylase
MKSFEPKFENIVKAAKNIEVERIPLYEHGIGHKVMEDILNKSLVDIIYGDFDDKKEYVRRISEFYKKMGYDFVNFDMNIGGAMPGSGALGGHVDPVIKNRDDFNKYPWDTVSEIYFEKYGDYFKALNEVIPTDMKAFGGPGNGIFECVQELVGFENLCYIKADDEELYADLFNKVGETNYKIWKHFLDNYSDAYCVHRFGDDLGFKSATMLAKEDIVDYIIPEYAKIIELIHSYKKPFLYHSCGCIFNVMDDIIVKAKIDAKHSNEDQIAPFPVWVEKYGDRIGNFGGIDTDAVCRLGKEEMRDYITEVVEKCKGHGGFAFGSGNSIPDYVPTENFIAMNEIIRGLRNE